MKYRIVDGEDGPTLMVSDQLLFEHRDVFEAAIDKLMARRAKRLTVDLAGLTYMDSAGLGMLLTLRDRADQAGATVTLCHPVKEVAELMDLACFDTLFSIVRA